MKRLALLSLPLLAALAALTPPAVTGDEKKKLPDTLGTIERLAVTKIKSGRWMFPAAS